MQYLPRSHAQHSLLTLHGRQPRRRGPRRRSASHTLLLERLEDRMLLASFLVTTAADNGNNASPTRGSLRQAILSADAVSGPSTIGFNIPSDSIAEFPVPTASSIPAGITTGPDGTLWFVERSGNKVARMNTAGTVTAEYTIPTPNSQPILITTGADGDLWFTENAGDKIGQISPSSVTLSAPMTVPADANVKTPAVPHTRPERRSRPAPRYRPAQSPSTPSPPRTAGRGGSRRAPMGRCGSPRTSTSSAGSTRSPASDHRVRASGRLPQCGRADDRSGRQPLVRRPRRRHRPGHSRGCGHDLRHQHAGQPAVHGHGRPRRCPWFPERTGKIGRITAFDATTTTDSVVPSDAVTYTPAGVVYAAGSTIPAGTLLPAGTITEYTIPTTGSAPTDLTVGAGRRPLVSRGDRRDRPANPRRYIHRVRGPDQQQRAGRDHEGPTATSGSPSTWATRSAGWRRSATIVPPTPCRRSPNR